MEQGFGEVQNLTPVICRQVAVPVPPFHPFRDECIMNFMELSFHVDFSKDISRGEMMWTCEPNVSLFNMDDMEWTVRAL